MKYRTLIIFFSFSFLGCKNSESENVVSIVKNESSSSDTITSHIDPLFQMHQDFDTLYFEDLNKDGINDTVIIISPVHAYPNPDGSSEGGCEDDSCLTQVQFSFTDSKLLHSSALGFQTFFSTGDLNSDGISEFAFIPNWFQSCWQGLFVYSLKKDQWVKIGSGSVYACSDEDFSRRITKIDNHSFKMISAQTNDDAVGLVDTTIVIRW